MLVQSIEVVGKDNTLYTLSTLLMFIPTNPPLQINKKSRKVIRSILNIILDP